MPSARSAAFNGASAAHRQDGTSIAPPNPLTAEQIENDCPAEIQDPGRRITAHLDKARAYEAKAHEKAGAELRKADDHWITVTQLLAEAKAKCDAGGFKAFKEKHCPNLSRSRIYELLSIGSGKKTLEEVRAEKSKRVNKSRSRVSATSSVADSEPEVPGEISDDGLEKDPEASAKLRKRQYTADEAATTTAPPAATKTVTKVETAPGKRVKHVDIIELCLAAPPAEIAKAFDGLGFNAIRAAMPSAWWPLIELVRLGARPSRPAGA